MNKVSANKQVGNSKPTSAGGANSKSSTREASTKSADKAGSKQHKPTVSSTVVIASTVAAVAQSKSSSPKLEIHEKNLKETAELLSREIENDSEPISYLVIDENERIQAFLRNRDSNYISLIDPDMFKPEKIRIAIIGSLRFDKPLVFDLMDNEHLIDSLRKICAELGPNVLDDLLSGKIRTESSFSSLIKDSDGDMYKPIQFVRENMNHFKVVLFLSKPTENQSLLGLAKAGVYKVV